MCCATGMFPKVFSFVKSVRRAVSVVNVSPLLSWHPRCDSSLHRCGGWWLAVAIALEMAGGNSRDDAEEDVREAERLTLPA